MHDHVIDQQARDLARQALAEIRAHAVECAALRRSQEQWQASATRILEDFRHQFMEYRKSSDQDLKDLKRSWDGFVIRLLMATCAGSFGVIGVLLWKLVFN